VDRRKESQVVSTFRSRASIYNSASGWALDPDLIEPMVPTVYGAGNALDACAGTGAVSAALIRAGWEVTPLDLVPEMWAGPEVVRVLKGSVEDLPFADSTFEISVCRQGLQYVDMVLALTELRRVATSQVLTGHIVAEDSSDRSFWEEYFAIASPGRRHVLVPGQVEDAAQAAGLLALKRETVYATDNVAGPVLHLPLEQQAAVERLFLEAPDGICQRYNIHVNDSHELRYSHRWEFLTFSVGEKP